jgi:hypothetical protein
MMEKIKGVALVMIGVVIFCAMIPLVLSSIDASGATGTAGTLLDYMPLFLAVGLVLAIIFWAVSSLKGDGGMVSIGGILGLGVMERIRTLRKQNKEGSISMGNMIGAIMVIVIGVLFFPIVQSAITGITGSGAGNLTGVAKTLASQIPLFYVIALVLIAVAWAITSAKD